MSLHTFQILYPPLGCAAFTTMALLLSKHLKSIYPLCLCMCVSCLCMRECVLSHFSHIRLFVTPWTVAHQASLSVGFSRQENWSGSHSLLQEIFPTQGSNLHLLHFRQILYCLRHQGSPPFRFKKF